MRSLGPSATEVDVLERSVYAGRYLLQGEDPWAPLGVRRKLRLAVEPGVRREVEVHLEEGQDVAGRVVDPEGLGIEGATVRWRTNQGGLDPSTSSGADGSFEFLCVSRSVRAIEVRHGAYLPTTIDGAELATHEDPLAWTLVLDPGLAISGTLPLESGEPAVGYAITLIPSDDRWRSRRNTPPTDAQGRFRISGLLDEPFDLRVRGYRRPNGEVAPAWNDEAESPIHARADHKAVPAGTEGLEMVLRFPERRRRR